MRELQVQKPGRAALIIGQLTNGQLAELMIEPNQVASLTKAVRRSGAATLRRHETLQLDHFGGFVGPNALQRAFEIEEALPAVGDLNAEYRFADLAATLPSPYPAVVGIVGYLAKSLPVGGGPSPERIGAVVDTLTDHDDPVTVYGRSLEGFSIPVIQTAARSVFERCTFFPTPAEMLQAAKEARRFYWALRFAARKQRDLASEAATLIERSANLPSMDDEVPF